MQSFVLYSEKHPVNNEQVWFVFLFLWFAARIGITNPYAEFSHSKQVKSKHPLYYYIQS